MEGSKVSPAFLLETSKSIEGENKAALTANYAGAVLKALKAKVGEEAVKAKVAESGLDLAKVAGSEEKVEEFLKEKVRSRNGCRYILFI